MYMSFYFYFAEEYLIDQCYFDFFRQSSVGVCVDTLQIDNRQYIDIFVKLAGGQLAPMRIPIDALSQAAPSPAGPVLSPGYALPSPSCQILLQQSLHLPLSKSPAAFPSRLPSLLPRFPPSSLQLKSALSSLARVAPSPSNIQPSPTLLAAKSPFISRVLADTHSVAAPQTFVFQSPPVLIQSAVQRLITPTVWSVRPTGVQSRPTILHIIPDSVQATPLQPIVAKTNTPSGSESVSSGGGITQSTKQVRQMCTFQR